jgi:hypothetical protein
MDKVEPQTGFIWRDDEEIVHMVATGMRSTEQSVEHNLRSVAAMTGGKRVPILFHAEKWQSGDAASWRRLIELIESVCSSAAVLMPEADWSKLGRFPELLDSLVIPFRMFSDEAAATAFLRSHNQ